MESNLQQIYDSQIEADEKLRDKSRERVELEQPGATRTGLLQRLLHFFRR